jgi:hypothetical protein
MADLPDFQLLTSFYLSRPSTNYISLVKEYAFNTPNNGIIAIGCVLNNTTWVSAGYLVGSFDYLTTTGDRLVSQQPVYIRQSTAYSQFQVITFPYPLIGFQFTARKWIDSISCEVYLEKLPPKTP